MEQRVVVVNESSLNLSVLGFITGIILTVLKLLGLINISWFWATFAFWIIPAIWMVLIILMLLIVFIVGLTNS